MLLKEFQGFLRLLEALVGKCPRRLGSMHVDAFEVLRERPLTGLFLSKFEGFPGSPGKDQGESQEPRTRANSGLRAPGALLLSSGPQAFQPGASLGPA